MDEGYNCTFYYRVGVVQYNCRNFIVYTHVGILLY